MREEQQEESNPVEPSKPVQDEKESALKKEDGTSNTKENYIS